MRHYIYQFHCFESEMPDGGKQDYCKVDVYAGNEKDALKQVKGLIKKKYYELAQILEYYPPAKDRPDYIVTVQCFRQMVGSGLVENVLMQVWASSVEEALETAKKLIDKKHYRIHTIVQKLQDEI